MSDFLHISALGSGSSGNCLVISNSRHSLMVDAGFSCRETLRRLSLLSPAPPAPAAVLITHDHTDHVKGCRVFCDERDIPAGVSLRAAEYLCTKDLLPQKCFKFEPGSAFEVADFQIRTFPVPHDAMDPVGFVIRSGRFTVGIATDLGEIDSVVLDHLSDCDALILESNYDPELLRSCSRPLRLKRRIAGRHGHLENSAMCEALPRLLSARTKLLMLVHLSSECNHPELVEMMARKKLDELNRPDIVLSVTDQNCPSGPFLIQGDV